MLLVLLLLTQHLPHAAQLLGFSYNQTDPETEQLFCDHVMGNFHLSSSFWIKTNRSLNRDNHHTQTVSLVFLQSYDFMQQKLNCKHQLVFLFQCHRHNQTFSHTYLQEKAQRETQTHTDHSPHGKNVQLNPRNPDRVESKQVIQMHGANIPPCDQKAANVRSLF